MVHRAPPRLRIPRSSRHTMGSRTSSSLGTRWYDEPLTQVVGLYVPIVQHSISSSRVEQNIAVQVHDLSCDALPGADMIECLELHGHAVAECWLGWCKNVEAYSFEAWRDAQDGLDRSRRRQERRTVSSVGTAGSATTTSVERRAGNRSSGDGRCAFPDREGERGTIGSRPSRTQLWRSAIGIDHATDRSSPRRQLLRDAILSYVTTRTRNVS